MIDKVVLKLTQSFNRVFNDFKGIYVFGECVHGNCDDDIELVALFEHEDKAKREQIWPMVGKIETEYDVCIDLYPYTDESFKQDEFVYEQVMKEGIFYNNKGVKECHK
jgi:hypothetical protein